jgi:hypothetical protein
MIKGRSQQIIGSKWFVPLFSVAMGLVILAVSWIGGHPGEGAFSLALMTGFGLVVLLAGRSETIRGLRGDGRDERFAQIDLRATAVAGQVLILALIASWLTQIASGHTGRPYDWLLAVGGIGYLLAVAFFRWRG